MLQGIVGLVVWVAFELPGIAVQVLEAHRVVGTAEATLEQGPKRLDAVGVHRAASVLATSVMDAGMAVIGQAPVGGLVDVEPGPRSQMCPHERLQGDLPVVGCHRHPDSMGRLVLEPDQRSLANRAASGAQLSVRVFVCLTVAHVGFIDLGRTLAQYRVRAVRLADAMRQMPGGLVGNAQVPVQLAARHTLEPGRRQVQGDVPDAVAQVGAVPDGRRLDREVPAAGASAVGLGLACRACLDILRVAARIVHAVRPSLPDPPAFCRGIVGEAVAQLG